MTPKQQRCQDVHVGLAFIDKSNEYQSLLQARVSFTLILVGVILSIQDHIVTVRCRTAIKPLFLYFNLCLKCKYD